MSGGNDRHFEIILMRQAAEITELRRQIAELEKVAISARNNKGGMDLLAEKNEELMRWLSELMRSSSPVLLKRTTVTRLRRILSLPK